MSAGLFQAQDEKETSCRVAGMRPWQREGNPLASINSRHYGITKRMKFKSTADLGTVHLLILMLALAGSLSTKGALLQPFLPSESTGVQKWRWTMCRRLASRLPLHNLRVNVLGFPDWFKTVRRTPITSAIIPIAFFAATREVVQIALMKAFVSEPASPLAMFACAGQCETPHGTTPKYRPRPFLLITTSTVSRIAFLEL